VKEMLESLVDQMIEKQILLDEGLAAFEKKFIQAVLTQTRGNQCRAAEILGIHRNTLSRKLTLHKINGRLKGKGFLSREV
jgi:Fis family transcriptional regulator, factor for inversion stimulation protein